MGTTAEFNVALAGKGAAGIRKASDAAESRILELDTMLSIFDSSSVVSKINNDAKKRTVEVPPELFNLIKMAKEYFTLTQGAFDITVEPLTAIWGFGPTERTAPDIQAIRSALEYVGLDKIELDEENKAIIFKDPRLRLDFGGFAKGYAVDEAVRIFKRSGVTDGLVNIGGDLYCMGANAGNKEWSIGIKDPQNRNKVLAVLEIREKAIATSGTYENFYIYNDKRYSHIIDPRSGYTVTSDITSVTIIADDCATADALATAVFVLGEGKALELIEKLSDIECLLVMNRDGKRNIVMSSGMEKYTKQDGM